MGSWQSWLPASSAVSVVPADVAVTADKAVMDETEVIATLWVFRLGCAAATPLEMAAKVERGERAAEVEPAALAVLGATFIIMPSFARCWKLAASLWLLTELLEVRQGNQEDLAILVVAADLAMEAGTAVAAAMVRAVPLAQLVQQVAMDRLEKLESFGAWARLASASSARRTNPNNSLDRPKSAQATKRLGQRFHCKKLHQTARSHSSKRCQRFSLDRAFLVNNAG